MTIFSKPTLPLELADHLLFKGFEELWLPYEALIIKKTYSKLNFIFNHSEAATGFWILTQGYVKIIRQTPNGKEAILGLLQAGDFLGEASLIAHHSYPFSAEVISDKVETYYIPAEILQKLMLNNSKLSFLMMKKLVELNIEQQFLFEHMITMDSKQRLGCFLMHLNKKQTLTVSQNYIPFEKNDIANFLGMTPETFSRGLKHLREHGIEVKGQHIHIAETNTLKYFVCNNCSRSGSRAFNSTL